MKRKHYGLIFIFALILFFIPVSFASANTDQLIIVNKAKNQLAFYEKGKLVRTFSVGTGKTRALTPEGVFRVIVKAKNVPYYKHNIPGGHPNNPLGPRWIGINVPGTNGWEYGIHGNNNPSSIGKYVSAGCIRMHNNEVIWLYDRVKYNTRVIITHTNQHTFDQIAEKYGYKVQKPTPPKPKIVEVEVPVYVNSEKKNFAQKSYLLLESNRVIVPMRAIFQELGAEVHWDENSKQVTAIKGNNTVTLKVNSKNATVNGKSITLDAPAQIRKDHTYVPVRFVSEALGAQVNWDAKQRIVSLTLEDPETIIDVVTDEVTTVEGFEENYVLYLSLRDIVNVLNGELNYLDENTMFITFNEEDIELDLQNKLFYRNGEPFELQEVPRLKNNKTYISTQFLQDVLNLSFEIEKNGNNFRITLK